MSASDWLRYGILFMGISVDIIFLSYNYMSFMYDYRYYCKGIKGARRVSAAPSVAFVFYLFYALIGLQKDGSFYFTNQFKLGLALFLLSPSVSIGLMFAHRIAIGIICRVPWTTQFGFSAIKNEAEKALLVTGIHSESARRAGLKEGDLIVSVNGYTVSEHSEELFGTGSGFLRGNNIVELCVRRSQGKESTLRLPIQN